jgi:hypothetical protein
MSVNSNVGSREHRGESAHVQENPWMDKGKAF